MKIYIFFFVFVLFLLACNPREDKRLESEFNFQDIREILSLHGNWKVTTDPDFQPELEIPTKNFSINYIPRMWFNSGIKGKYIVSYITEVNFSEEVIRNKFGVLIFNAINSNETYINGKLIGKKGFVDKDKLKIQNNASPSLYHIPKDYLREGKNQILIRVADNAASGGFLEAPRICEISVCEKSFNQFLLITGGTGFFMLFIGLYHLLLYLGNRKDKALIYFGAGTFFHALTFLGYERIIYFFSGNFLVHFYTMNLSYTFSCLLAIMFIHSFLEKKINLISKILFGCFSFGLLSTIIAGISLEYRAIHSRYILLMNVMGFVPLLSLQVINLTLKAYKERTVGSSFILFGFVIFIFTSLLVPLHLLYIIPTKPFTLEGSLILIINVTIALSLKAKQTSQRLLDLERKFRTDMEKEVSEKTKALEFKNQELNKTNLMKNKLFSIIAHDLRNPLFALEEVIFLFQDKHLTPQALQENIFSLSQNLENNRFLLENLLQWSYIQLDYSLIKLERIDFPKLINEVVQLYNGFAEKKEILIQVNLKNNVTCIGDEGIIRLILRNLISNAIKFTPRNGKVEISYGKKKSLSFISVKDNGIGMPKKKLKNFFSQAKIEKNNHGTEGEGGSGIGLTLCKDFAERMNGKMTVKSKEKEGSIFIMTWEENGL